MADKKIFPKGISGFQKLPTQPPFVLGRLMIYPDELVAWLRSDEGQMSMKMYKDKKQLSLQILMAQTGNFLNFPVDTYDRSQAPIKPRTEQPVSPSENHNWRNNTDDSSLPF